MCTCTMYTKIKLAHRHGSDFRCVVDGILSQRHPGLAPPAAPPGQGNANRQDLPKTERTMGSANPVEAAEQVGETGPPGPHVMAG